MGAGLVVKSCTATRPPPYVDTRSDLYQSSHGGRQPDPITHLLYVQQGLDTVSNLSNHVSDSLHSFLWDLLSRVLPIDLQQVSVYVMGKYVERPAIYRVGYRVFCSNAVECRAKKNGPRS